MRSSIVVVVGLLSNSCVLRECNLQFKEINAACITCFYIGKENCGMCEGYGNLFFVGILSDALFPDEMRRDMYAQLR